MASERQSRPPTQEVINLISSDDSDDESATATSEQIQHPLHENFENEFLNIDDDAAAFYHAPATPPLPRPDLGAAGPEQRGTIINVGGEDVFIPDEEDPFRVPGASNAAVHNDHELALALDEQVYTAEQCLQQVLEIFKDVDHDHVRKLYNEFDSKEGYESISGPARFDNIVEQLLSATSYPKQEKGKEALKKRKREDSITETDSDRWERPGRETVPRQFQGSMRAILKADFTEIPQLFIQNTLAQRTHLYQAYIALADARHSYDPAKPAYGKGRGSTKNLADAATIAMSSGFPALVDELRAAQTRAATMKAQRAAELAQKVAEQANLERAKERGETAECSVCYDDMPMNRMIHCDGTVAHFTCYGCMNVYIKTEVGESRCNVKCTAGCGSGFAYRQLQLLSDKQLLEKLAEIEQEKAIRDAGLDDLEECPFCDYKAILPPIEEDFEFRCANPECEKVSCRRCKAVSHIPLSCEQHAKDNKINSRHKIEEAMTAALIRSCNKCKKQFIKDFGCNKMSCSSCGNLQCYVCSASVTDYNHFDQTGPGGRRVNGQAVAKCPLYDNVEERHEREVKEAEAAARAQVIEENPDVDPSDLEFKVSDAVKKATRDRIQRGGPQGMGAEFMGQHMPNFVGPGNVLGLDGLLNERYGGARDPHDQLAQINLRLDDALQQAREHLRNRGIGARARPPPMQFNPGAAAFGPAGPAPYAAAPLQPPAQLQPFVVAYNRDVVAAPMAQHQPGPNEHIMHHAQGAPHIFDAQPMLPVIAHGYDPYNHLQHDFGNDGAADELQDLHARLNELERHRVPNRRPAPFMMHRAERGPLPGDALPADPRVAINPHEAADMLDEPERHRAARRGPAPLMIRPPYPIPEQRAAQQGRLPDVAAPATVPQPPRPDFNRLDRLMQQRALHQRRNLALRAEFARQQGLELPLDQQPGGHGVQG